jgi:hypothetical protein
MGADFDNPSDQFLIGNLRGQFDIKGLRMLLLDWIVNELWSGNVYWLDFFQG